MRVESSAKNDAGLIVYIKASIDIQSNYKTSGSGYRDAGCFAYWINVTAAVTDRQ